MKKSIIWLSLGIILLISAIVLTVYYVKVDGFTVLDSNYGNPYISSYLREPQETSAPVEEAEPFVPAPYVSPIDFEKLQQDNPDSCAWVVIPESPLSFPLVQHPTDNQFYLTHVFDLSYSTYGAAFIETYNNRDFNDPVTVIYGHKINDGKWFGELQTIFNDPDAWEKSRDITVYLPNEERIYRVFAAVPHDKTHLLHYNDFSNPKVYSDFIKEVAETRTLESMVDLSSLPEPGTRLLILSTCLKSDRTHRFLVLAAEMPQVS